MNSSRDQEDFGWKDERPIWKLLAWLIKHLALIIAATAALVWGGPVAGFLVRTASAMGEPLTAPTVEFLTPSADRAELPSHFAAHPDVPRSAI
ncbi:MAG: hypothetical protein K5880_09930 [Hydrogenophaga sp.]|uniref:hypothetical protein n=1 Tax=Hydrogenophaga sp. TaxID=1904254 RepID=UPI0026208234|nr:hypothetical protein [Hydrogenophaga sp.]MCV0438940.1 hypothetical protein [Hydrogenophaga sp.]